MDSTFQLLFAAAVGFGHAFEADHLVAVGNMVTRRNKILPALKDGVFWGLGHTSTIFIIGSVVILFKTSIDPKVFDYFEAFVGIMLIWLGIWRWYKYTSQNESNRLETLNSNHNLAYGIGLIHGLAGSGAMILLVMTKIEGVLSSIAFLGIFGLGSIVGMLVAAGIFILPFSKHFHNQSGTHRFLIFLSSLLCVGYGVYMIVQNLTT